MTEESKDKKPDTGKKEEKKPSYKKKKGKKLVTKGCVYIQATYNNTLITITDQDGNVIAWSSSGHKGFKGAKKATPYAAGEIVKDVTEKVKNMGLKEIDIYIKGVGSGREAAVRALNAQGFSISLIKDTTPLPHNGCRHKKPRRI